MHKETKKFPSKVFGDKGEQIAQQFLLRKGFKILELNYRYSYGEVDIIGMDKEVLVIIEVKTRSSAHFGAPEEFVSPQQEALLFESAMVYMEEIGHDWEIRFDIISIVHQGTSFKIKHLEDAFFPGMP